MNVIAYTTLKHTAPCVASGRKIRRLLRE